MSSVGHFWLIFGLKVKGLKSTIYRPNFLDILVIWGLPRTQISRDLTWNSSLNLLKIFLLSSTMIWSYENFKKIFWPFWSVTKTFFNTKNENKSQKMYIRSQKDFNWRSLKDLKKILGKLKYGQFFVFRNLFRLFRIFSKGFRSQDPNLFGDLHKN